MLKIKSIFHRWPKLLLLLIFLIGGLSTGYSQTKVQKDGKYKQKKHKSADHHQKEIRKDGKHKKEFRQHSGNQNKTFSKKKKKKLK